MPNSQSWISLSGGRSAMVRVLHNARSQQFRVTAHLEVSLLCYGEGETEK